MACRGASDETGALGLTLHPPEVTRLLAATPHRLAVVYWPAPGGCEACDSMIVETLKRWTSETSSPADLLIVTLLPEQHRSRALSFPGTIVAVEKTLYARLAKLAPQPRVEIWSGAGHLLLLRSIPNFSTQVAMLDEELFAARSFTAPVSPTAAPGVSP